MARGRVGPNPVVGIHFWDFRFPLRDVCSGRIPGRECRKGGHSRWSSRTRFSSVWTAAPTSYSPLVNNFSFTINNSRTNPNAARTARVNAPRHWDCRKMAAIISAWKPRRSAPDASAKLPCRSSLRRDVQCFAGSASSSAKRLLLQPS
jgi:hypothetical protein